MLRRVLLVALGALIVGWLFAAEGRAQTDVTLTLTYQEIQDGYQEVFGRQATPKEVEYLQGSDVETKPELVSRLKNYLTLPEGWDELLDMINRVYYYGMGRESEGYEFEYWQKQVKSKKLGFSDLMKATRKWLQTEGGAKDAREMIHRAYFAALGRKATDVDLGYWQSSIKQKSILHYELVATIMEFMTSFSRETKKELEAMIKRAYRAVGGLGDPNEYEIEGWYKVIKREKAPFWRVVEDLKKNGEMTREATKY